MSQPNYTIEKGADGEENFIHTSGKPYKFKMSDVTVHLTELLRGQKECKAQVALENAKMTNILEHNPIIKDLSDEQLHAIHLYFSTKVMRDQFQNRLDQIEAQIAEYTEDVAEIKRQTGIEYELPTLPEVAPAVEAAA